MQRGTVLLVTANRDAWQPIATSLEELGFNVIGPERVVSAAVVVEESSMDCVVCDAGIEGQQLNTIVDTVRATDRHTPLLLLGEPEDWKPIVTAIERGATTHLSSKNHDALVTEIRRAVSRSAVESHRAVINDLQAATRRIANSLLSAESHQELNALIYEALTASGLYKIIYVGQFDEESGHLNHTHPLPGSLNPADFDPLVDATNGGILERAHSTQAIQVASGPVPPSGERQPQQQSHSSVSIRADSLAAVPLVYGERSHGLILLGTNRDWAFDATETKLLDEIGALTGALSALTDSRSEQRNIDEFTENLLHELRNPLAVAKAHLALARDEDEPDAYRRVDAALDRIDRIIETVGTAQLDAVDETSSRDIGTTAQEGWASVKTDDAELKIESTRHLEADHDKLERLFANLFRNAITHGRSDVTVRVGVTETGFYVEDDGPGIPREHWDRVFDRGYSLGDGLGIGLDIVRRIVNAHGWEIEIQASKEGGARFEITSVDTEPWNWNDTPVQ